MGSVSLLSSALIKTLSGIPLLHEPLIGSRGRLLFPLPGKSRGERADRNNVGRLRVPDDKEGWLNENLYRSG